MVIGLILLIGRLASYVRYRREMKSGGEKGGKGPSGKVSFSEWLNSNGSGGGDSYGGGSFGGGGASGSW